MEKKFCKGLYLSFVDNIFRNETIISLIMSTKAIKCTPIVSCKTLKEFEGITKESPFDGYFECHDGSRYLCKEHIWSFIKQFDKATISTLQSHSQRLAKNVLKWQKRHSKLLKNKRWGKIKNGLDAIKEGIYLYSDVFFIITDEMQMQWIKSQSELQPYPWNPHTPIIVINKKTALNYGYWLLKVNNYEPIISIQPIELEEAYKNDTCRFIKEICGFKNQSIKNILLKYLKRYVAHDRKIVLEYLKEHLASFDSKKFSDVGVVLIGRNNEYKSKLDYIPFAKIGNYVARGIKKRGAKHVVSIVYSDEMKKIISAFIRLSYFSKDTTGIRFFDQVAFVAHSDSVVKNGKLIKIEMDLDDHGNDIKEGDANFLPELLTKRLLFFGCATFPTYGQYDGISTITAGPLLDIAKLFAGTGLFNWACERIRPKIKNITKFY